MQSRTLTKNNAKGINIAALIAFTLVLRDYWLTQVIDHFWVIVIFASVVLGNLVCIA